MRYTGNNSLRTRRLSAVIDGTSGLPCSLRNLRTGTGFFRQDNPCSIEMDYELTCLPVKKRRPHAQSGSREGLPDIAGGQTGPKPFTALTTSVSAGRGDPAACTATMRGCEIEIALHYVLDDAGLHVFPDITNIAGTNILLNIFGFTLNHVRIGRKWTDEYLLPTIGNAITFTNDRVQNLRERCNKDDPRPDCTCRYPPAASTCRMSCCAMSPQPKPLFSPNGSINQDPDFH